MNEKTITIFGTSRAGPGEPAYVLAYEAGKLLAGAGFTIANGGYGGTMLAAAKGAAEAGGTIIGVTCSAFKNSKANEYITREVDKAGAGVRCAARRNRNTAGIGKGLGIEKQRLSRNR
ncbi:MAG: SLOG cluster 4 domain-containing protein [Planctomycetota bacterium]